MSERKMSQEHVQYFEDLYKITGSRKRVAFDDTARVGSLKHAVAAHDATDHNIKLTVMRWHEGAIDDERAQAMIEAGKELKAKYEVVELEPGMIQELESLDVTVVKLTPKDADQLTLSGGYYYRTHRTARDGRVMWYHAETGGYSSGSDFYNRAVGGWLIEAIVSEDRAPLPPTGEHWL